MDTLRMRLVGKLVFSVFANLIFCQFAIAQSDPSNFFEVIDVTTEGFDFEFGLENDTQVNILEGGEAQFQQAIQDFSGNGSTNVELNVLGGTLGSFLSVNDATTVNVIDGVVGLGFSLNSNSVLSVQGGTFEGGFSVNSGLSLIHI